MRFLIPIILMALLPSCATRPGTISKTAIVPSVAVVGTPKLSVATSRPDVDRLRAAVATGDQPAIVRAADDVVVRVTEIETTARIAIAAQEAVANELIATRAQIPAIQEAAREDVDKAARIKDAAVQTSATERARADTAEGKNSSLRKWAWGGGAAGALGLLLFLASLFRR